MLFEKVLALNADFIGSFGYLIVFFGVIFEAFPLIGSFVPGSIILFFGGLFSRLGYMNLWFVFLLGTLGAFFGDLLGYGLGKVYGLRVMKKCGKWFLIKKEYLDKSCDIVHNHTGKSLVMGRFHPLTRSVAPFVLGAHKVDFKKFLIFNFIGAFLWTYFFVSVGFFFGESYKILKGYEKGMWILTLGFIFTMYGIYFVKEFFKKRNGKAKVTENGIVCKNI